MKALDAAEIDESDLDESMLDEQQIMREVEEEERAQELKIKNQQMQMMGSFFSRLFNRNQTSFDAQFASPGYAGSYSSRSYQRPTSRHWNDEHVVDDDDEYSQDQRPGSRWQQVQVKASAVGAFGRRLHNNRRTSQNSPTVEDDEVAAAASVSASRHRGRADRTVSKSLNAQAVLKTGNASIKPPTREVANDENDDDLPPPVDEEDDGWDAPPPLEESDMQSLPQRNQVSGSKGGSYVKKGGNYDMPPPPDDDDLPPPPQSDEDEAPPAFAAKPNRHSRN
jgi:hypothetical protein